MSRFRARLILSLGLITAVGFGCKPEPMVAPSTSPPAVSAKPAEKTANGKEEEKKPNEDPDKKAEPEEKKPADDAKPEATPEKKAE